MKTIRQLTILFLIAGLGSINASAQNLEVGMEYVLVLEDENKPNYLKFPSKREIIKRGAIADYQNLNGIIVVIDSIESNDQQSMVSLKRKDGKPFFRFFKTIKADIYKALEKGELARI